MATTLDALAADEEMADIAGAENPVEIGAFETVRAVVDHHEFAARRLKRVDNLDLPGADDALVLVLGALQQWIVLILRHFWKARTPADVDEDGQQPARTGGGEHLLRVPDGIVLVDLREKIPAPDPFRVAHAVLPVQHQQCRFR